MKKNYLIYVDREGKMPILSHTKRNYKSHPFYIRYVNNTPVAYHGPAEIHAKDITRSKVWDHCKSCFVPINIIPQE